MSAELDVVIIVVELCSFIQSVAPYDMCKGGVKSTKTCLWANLPLTFVLIDGVGIHTL